MTAENPPTPARAWRFLILAVGSTWVFWWIAMALGNPISDPHVISLVVAGGLCVPLTAVVLLYAARDPIAMSDYWHRMFDVRRLTIVGFFVAIAIMPGLGLLAAMADGFLTG